MNTCDTPPHKRKGTSQKPRSNLHPNPPQTPPGHLRWKENLDSLPTRRVGVEGTNQRAVSNNLSGSNSMLVKGISVNLFNEGRGSWNQSSDELSIADRLSVEQSYAHHLQA